MPVTPPPPITPVPTPVIQRGDRATFSDRVDEFVTWLEDAPPEFSAVADNVEANATDAATSASSASVSASGASTSATNAANSASAASTSATNAANSASAAATSQGGAATNAAAAQASASSAATSATNAANSAAASAASAAAANAVVTNVSVVRHSCRPSLLLPFANTRRVDPRITVTRASTGGRFNARGLYETVAANMPRLDHDPATQKPLGLLVEEQRTNLLTYTERFDNAAWAKAQSTAQPQAAVAPDGTVTAAKIIESTAGSTQHFVSQQTPGLPDNTEYTVSVFAKFAGRAWLQIAFRDKANVVNRAWFNVQTGTVGSGFVLAMIPVGNGWYRCVAKFSTASGAFGTEVRFQVQTANNETDYTGDGVSGIYTWGAQLEAGAFATSYISSTTTFTSRASSGSFTGSNGLIQSAGTNVARMQYNPLDLYAPAKLLLEAAATNLLLRSEEFDNAAWVKTNTTVTANSTVAPDGVTSMDMLDGTVGSAVAAQSASIPAGTTTPYTASIFLKQGTAAQTSFDMVFFTGGTANTAKVTITWATTSIATSGTASGISARMMPLGNGVYRFEVTGANSGGNNSALQFAFYPSHIGTGTVYAWGAQIEAGSFATSYIATTSAQVTRAADVSSSAQATRSADVVSMPVSASWFNPVEGTVYVEADTIGLGTTNRFPWLSRLDDGTNNNTIGFWINDPSGDLIAAQIKNAGVIQLDALSSVVATAGAPIKAVLGYKTNDSAFSINGGAATVDTACTVPAISRLFIGNGDYPLNGHVKRISYYPRRLSNAELQGLTQQ